MLILLGQDWLHTLIGWLFSCLHFSCMLLLLQDYEIKPISGFHFMKKRAQSTILDCLIAITSNNISIVFYFFFFRSHTTFKRQIVTRPIEVIVHPLQMFGKMSK